MDNIKVCQYASEMIKKYPEHSSEIYDLYQLYVNEVEDDSTSQQNEAILFYESVEQLIENNNE